jgi:hypothetical protein
VNDSRKAAALAARVFFKNPSGSFTLIGITGTNGKTTTSLMLFQALGLLGHNCGWIGTLGYKIGKQDFPTSHTTPDIIQLNEIFAAMWNKVSAMWTSKSLPTPWLWIEFMELRLIIACLAISLASTWIFMAAWMSILRPSIHSSLVLPGMQHAV